MARLRYNGLVATLGGDGLTSSETTIDFAAALTHSNGTAVPTISGSDYIPLSIVGADGLVAEIVYLTAYTSGATTGTITRAQEGTAGVSHAAGVKVSNGPTVADFADDVPDGQAGIDEFSDGVIDPAWVRVDKAGGEGRVTWAEGGSSLTCAHAAVADAAEELHAMVRPLSGAGGPLAVGDAFVTRVSLLGPAATNYSMAGLVLADAAASGAGVQVVSLHYHGVSGRLENDLRHFTNYTACPGLTGNIALNTNTVYSRLVMVAANTWRQDLSPDGVVWLTGTNRVVTVTPTHVGLVNTSWGSTTRHVVSFDFLRRMSGVT